MIASRARRWLQERARLIIPWGVTGASGAPLGAAAAVLSWPRERSARVACYLRVPLSSPSTTPRRPRKRTWPVVQAWELALVRGAKAGTVFRIERRAYILGREEEADIRIDAEGVSRRHAKLLFCDDGLPMLLDLDSTNGTFVGEERIDATVLRPGQRIALGAEVELELRPRMFGAVPKRLEITPRESEIVELVGRGLTNREIAAELDIAVRTVATHLENLYKRFEVGSRAALVRRLLELRG